MYIFIKCVFMRSICSLFVFQDLKKEFFRESNY